MGYRDILNQLKGMKPLPTNQMAKLKMVAMAKPVKRILPNPINTVASLNPNSTYSKQVAKDENNTGVPYAKNSLRGYKLK